LTLAKRIEAEMMHVTDIPISTSAIVYFGCEKQFGITTVTGVRRNNVVPIALIQHRADLREHVGRAAHTEICGLETTVPDKVSTGIVARVPGKKPGMFSVAFGDQSVTGEKKMGDPKRASSAVRPRPGA
jgi:hypothetical protein